MSEHRRTARWVLAALTAAVAACSGAPESLAPSSGASPVAEGGKRRIKIALIAKSSTNPVFLAARTGAGGAGFGW